MNKIKVYQVFESYPLFYQPYIPPTLELLAQQRDVDSKIIAFKGESNNNNTEILPAYRKRRTLEMLLGAFKKESFNILEIKALNNKVDIIHLQHSFLFNKVTSLLHYPKNKRPKVVITLRGGDTYIKPWISERWHSFFKNYGHIVDAFIVMSKDQKSYLQRWKVPEDRIYVIPISFGDKFELESKSPNSDTMRIISVFRMCWEKNIADNLRLVREIRNAGVDVEYDIYGDGPDLGQLYYLTDRYGLNNVVNIQGKVDNAIIKKRLRSYDFILQLSHSESFGMSVVEAQANGVPAVVSSTDGLVDIVINNQTGMVLEREFDLEKSALEIIDLWRNKDLYKVFSKKSILRTQKSFNTEVEVDHLVKLYKKLL